jgi:tetratricopeptide (TPR) repeat protein
LPLLKKAMLTRTRRLRFAEVSAQAMKLASRPETVQNAIDFVKGNLNDLGPRGHDLLREMYEAQKSWSKAMEVVDGILLQKPENLNAINHKGRLLLKLGRHDDALKYMEHADKLAPNNIQRINEMAMAYLAANKPDMSVKQMRELIRYHPDQPEVKFDMFARLHEFGFDDYAISLCKDTTDPLEAVRHYNNKGVALAKAGNIEGAIMEYERSLRFYPKYKENYRILYNIALAHLSYRTRSHYEIALDYVMRCLEMNDKFEKAIKTRGGQVGSLALYYDRMKKVDSGNAAATDATRSLTPQQAAQNPFIVNFLNANEKSVQDAQKEQRYFLFAFIGLYGLSVYEALYDPLDMRKIDYLRKKKRDRDRGDDDERDRDRSDRFEDDDEEAMGERRRRSRFGFMVLPSDKSYDVAMGWQMTLP